VPAAQPIAKTRTKRLQEPEQDQLAPAPVEFLPQATTVAKTKPVAQAKKKAVARVKPVEKAPAAQAKPRAKSQPKPQAKSQPKPQAKSQPKPQAKAKPAPAARRPTKPTTLSVSPLDINTALAAEVAANMVLNHMLPNPRTGPSQRAATTATNANLPKRETSTFKHLKESVANPPSHHLDGLFGAIATKKQPRLPFNRYASVPTQHFDKGFGIDVKRTNLPRRKAG
jgi:hypothetical protein